MSDVVKRVYVDVANPSSVALDVAGSEGELRVIVDGELVLRIRGVSPEGLVVRFEGRAVS